MSDERLTWLHWTPDGFGMSSIRSDGDDGITAESADRLLQRIAELEAEARSMRDALEYIMRRGYSGASFIASEALHGEPLPDDLIGRAISAKAKEAGGA